MSGLLPRCAEAASSLDDELTPSVLFFGIGVVCAGDHFGELRDGLPPGGQGNEGEEQMGGVYAGVENAFAPEDSADRGLPGRIAGRQKRVVFGAPFAGRRTSMAPNNPRRGSCHAVATVSL